LKVLIKRVAVRSLPAVEQKRLDDWIRTFSFSHPNPDRDLASLVALLDDNVYTFRDYLEKLISLSACLIKKREVQDLSHPDNKKKRKSFTLSKGAEELIETLLSSAATVPGEDLSQLKWEQLPVDLNQLKDVTETFFVSRNNERRKPKVPKGVCDTDPFQSTVKNMAFDIIKGVYSEHGAVEIDTPVFELKETLLGKYGEEGSKLIYDLADQGGELLSLRYDLTVPFARYLATHNLKRFKRFHIGKVYRRDQPDVNKGRFREFYQCDFDIAGECDLMVPDAEALTIMHEVMTRVDVGDFEVKLSHRGLLEGIVALSGAPEQKFKTICSAIDKLDKEPWSTVAEELLEKGLEPQTVEKIGKFVLHRGKIDDVLEKVRSEQLFNGHERSEQSLAELELLSKYLKHLKSYDSIVLDLSLARGLDYYTGLIFEIGVLGANVGSVGGGGRYDKLVGMFGTTQIPCVGFSIGIERIFVLLEKKLKDANQAGRQNYTEFLVASSDDGMMEEKMELIGLLWKRSFKCEMLYEVSPKPKKQLAFALNNKIPFVIWISEEGVKKSVVKIKVDIRLTSAPISRKNGSSRDRVWCKNSRS
jgi:histidyl-tRNA synthetase